MTDFESSPTPSPGLVWVERGQALMEAGWEEEARVAFTRALSLDPELRAAYQALAMLYDPITAPTAEQWAQILRGEVPESRLKARKEQALTIDELLEEEG
ncbi:MAG: tetratricopeptide repeat protein [Ardenticatenales bacterium]|nr:tetratricopeptide repeat protein [Ardenticatenales bacterium]